MTDETIPTPAWDEISDPAVAVTAIQDTMEVFLETASVNNVYGEPTLHNNTLIIPAAEIVAGIGFGAGYGGGSGTNNKDNDQEEKEEKGNTGSGSGGGGGGGGRTFARPVAVIIASPEGVRIEPVVDVTKIALAMFTAAGFMAAMSLRMLKPKHALKALRNG
jgi:uncharacterized spore protein YtfJ